MSHTRVTIPRAFSLLEMLAAVAVISILIAIAAPAVGSYGRSTALATGGNMVANLAALARQTAIARNSMAALVLLGAQGTEEDFRAFTVAEYRPGQGWAQLTDWKTLPIGIVVDPSPPLVSTFLLNSPRPFPFLDGPPRQQNPPLPFKVRTSPTCRATPRGFFSRAVDCSIPSTRRRSGSSKASSAGGKSRTRDAEPMASRPTTTTSPSSARLASRKCTGHETDPPARGRSARFQPH